MARNVELKARVLDLSAVEACARSIADRGPFDLAQDDTFFACAKLPGLGVSEQDLVEGAYVDLLRAGR